MICLVVDDSEVHREKINGWLTELGHKVSFACDGNEGLQLLSENKYDLCIVDQTMPQLTGIEMLEHYRPIFLKHLKNEELVSEKQYKQLLSQDGYKKPDLLELSKQLYNDHLGKVLMLTADVGDSSLDYAAYLGVSYWIMKPVSKDTFNAIARKVGEER